MARPKKEITREKRIDVRMTVEEFERLSKIAATLGMTRTGALMAGVELLSKSLEKRG